MKLSGTYDRDEVDSFLTETVVPIRIACETPRGRLWMVSLWFRYGDGVISCATARSADLVTYLDHRDHVAFEVSTNDPPYRGVRGNGSVSVSRDEGKELLRELLTRYLGGTDSSLARGLLDRSVEEVAIELTPITVYSWDFSDRM
jgi:RNase P/RNase MRP subunit POP5